MFAAVISNLVANESETLNSDDGVQPVLIRKALTVLPIRSTRLSMPAFFGNELLVVPGGHERL